MSHQKDVARSSLADSARQLAKKRDRRFYPTRREILLQLELQKLVYGDSEELRAERELVEKVLK